MKPGPIVLNWRQKRHSQNGTIPSLPTKNSKGPSKVTITVFWDCEGLIPVDVIPRGKTINSKTYINTVTELRKPFKQVQPHKNPTEILLQHDSARLH